ncbi:MAG: class B sortase [Roseburia sp.]|nr:class B sortase [Roseburia sp.]
MLQNLKHFSKYFFIGLVAGLCILIAVFSAAGLLQLHRSTERSDALKAKLHTIAVQSEEDGDGLPVIDWENLNKHCPNAVGWLWCPDTKLDYPIVQAGDNSYYLNHLADETSDRHGAIFLDSRASPKLANRHTLIYGHNMVDGSMFQPLLKWNDAEYLSKHSRIYILTPAAAYKLDLFSAYETLPDSDTYRITFSGSDDFTAWRDELCRHSVFPAPSGIGRADRVVTLSTCTDSSHRFVLHGALSLYFGS